MRGAFEPPLDHAAHLGELLHQVRLRVQAAGGVDDRDVLAARPGRLDRVVGDRGRVGAARAPTKSASARSAQISSCSSAAARNVSAAPSSTERPCSRSFCASLPIVVVLPVPLTPTTRITLGVSGQVERAGLAEQLGDLLGERLAEVAELAARLEPADELGGRADADVARDQRLLEPLPVLVVAGIEGRGGELPVSARRLLPSESRSRPKKPCCSSSVSSGPSASPRSSAQLLAIGAER